VFQAQTTTLMQAAVVSPTRTQAEFTQLAYSCK